VAAMADLAVTGWLAVV